MSLVIIEQARAAETELREITPELFNADGSVKLRTALGIRLERARLAIVAAQRILARVEPAPPFAHPQRGPRLVTRS